MSGMILRFHSILCFCLPAILAAGFDTSFNQSEENFPQSYAVGNGRTLHSIKLTSDVMGPTITLYATDGQQGTSGRILVISIDPIYVLSDESYSLDTISPREAFQSYDLTSIDVDSTTMRSNVARLMLQWEEGETAPYRATAESLGNSLGKSILRLDLIQTENRSLLVLDISQVKVGFFALKVVSGDETDEGATEGATEEGTETSPEPSINKSYVENCKSKSNIDARHGGIWWIDITGTTTPVICDVSIFCHQYPQYPQFLSWIDSQRVLVSIPCPPGEDSLKDTVVLECTPPSKFIPEIPLSDLCYKIVCPILTLEPDSTVEPHELQMKLPVGADGGRVRFSCKSSHRYPEFDEGVCNNGSWSWGSNTGPKCLYNCNTDIRIDDELTCGRLSNTTARCMCTASHTSTASCSTSAGWLLQEKLTCNSSPLFEKTVEKILVGILITVGTMGYITALMICCNRKNSNLVIPLIVSKN